MTSLVRSFRFYAELRIFGSHADLPPETDDYQTQGLSL